MKAIITITALLSTLFLFSFNATASVAFGTKIQMDNKQTNGVENLEREDKILTISDESTRNNITKTQIRLDFVGRAKIKTAVIYMNYGDDFELIITLNQTVLTSNGRLVLASELVPGQDQLVDASGNAVNINFVFVGIFQGDFFDFAMNSKYVTENLFLANGVFLGSIRVNYKIEEDHNTEAFKGQLL